MSRAADAGRRADDADGGVGNTAAPGLDGVARADAARGIAPSGDGGGAAPDFPPPRPDPSAPAWANMLVPATWTPISRNTLADVDPEKDPALNSRHPNNAPWHGVQGQPCLVDCWNGAVLAPGFGTKGSLVTFGGGHNGYYGSEVYAFDLETLRWSRLSNPYAGPYNWPYNPAEYPDGSAIPPHTYDFVEYHPGTNSFVLLKGVVELGPSSNAVTVSIAHMFDLGTRKWRRSPLNAGTKLYSGGYSLYDPRRDVFWVEGGSGSNTFARFDPKPSNGDGTFGGWTNHPQKLTMTDSMAAHDPIHDLFVVTGFREGTSVYAIDLGNPNTARVALTEGGTAPRKEKGHGWEWSDRRQSFVYWRRGTDLYEFKPPAGQEWRGAAWTWSAIAAAAGSPAPQDDSGNGCYSRFRIARYGGVEVALVFNRTTGPVFAFRIP